MVNDGPIRTRVLGFHGVLALLLLMSGATPGRAADWTPLTNLAPNFPGTMILLSDGTVMVPMATYGCWGVSTAARR